MKKFFSLFAAVLFAGSMMAADATMTAGTNGSACTVNGVDGIKCGTSKAGGDMTITVGAGATKLSFYAAAWKGVTGLSLNLAADGVTISPASVSLTADDGISNNSPFTLAGSAEAFKFEVDLTGVSAETTIAVTSSAAKRFVVWGATYTAGDAPVEPTMAYYVAGSMTNWGPMAAYKLAANPANEGEYMGEFTFAANDEFKVGYSDGTTIESTNYFPTGIDNNYVITEAGDYTVYFRPDGQGGEGWHYGCIYAVKKEAPADPTNCAEAAEAALSVSGNNVPYNNGAVYTIEGYVTAIQTAYSDQYHNITFWMADTQDGGNVLEAYRAACASEADAPVVGDKVAVTGSLTKYGTTPEFAAGCTFTILIHTAIENTNVEAEVVKFFENGQLIIIKNGVRYNAQGAVVR